MTKTMEAGPKVSYCDLVKVSRQLENAVRELEGMVEDVANAKVVKELHGERMKQHLAKAMAGACQESMAKSEVMARIDPKYLANVDALAQDLLVAERVLIKKTTIETKIEGLRTAISLEKAVLGYTS